MELSQATIPEVWQRAMDRATADHLHAIRLDAGGYAVRSTSSHPGDHHIVVVRNGKIVRCTRCPGWGGRDNPCKHAGAVAKRLMRESKPVAPVVERKSDTAVIYSNTTRGQIYRTER